MPSEKFYHPATIEGHEQEAFDDGAAFAVQWGSPGNEVPLGSDHHVFVATVPLDRSGVNRLIKVLRKARDQAYGADG
ncbi:MAG TPA: hypothetical protein VIO38_15630 [Rariglobus sp.]